MTSWNSEKEFKTRTCVSHAKECPDFAALPRVVEVRTKYGEVTRCKHCKGTIWTECELKKAIASMEQQR